MKSKISKLNKIILDGINGKSDTVEKEISEFEKT
jgi:hypothetical protein